MKTCQVLQSQSSRFGFPDSPETFVSVYYYLVHKDTFKTHVVPPNSLVSLFTTVPI